MVPQVPGKSAMRHSFCPVNGWKKTRQLSTAIHCATAGAADAVDYCSPLVHLLRAAQRPRDLAAASQRSDHASSKATPSIAVRRSMRRGATPI